MRFTRVSVHREPEADFRLTAPDVLSLMSPLAPPDQAAQFGTLRERGYLRQIVERLAERGMRRKRLFVAGPNTGSDDRAAV